MVKMARTARYASLPAWDGDTYEVKLSAENPKGETKEIVVNVPKLSDLQNAMKVFGGETGPSNFDEKDSDGKPVPAKPSLLSFVQDAIEDYVTKHARAELQVFRTGPEKVIKSLVAKMVKAGIPENVAEEFARKQILGA